MIVNLDVVSDLLICSEQVVIESSLSDHIKDTLNSNNSSQVQSRGEQNLEASSNLPVSSNCNFAPMPPGVTPSQVILSNKPHNFSDNQFSVNTLNTVPGIKAYPYYSRMNYETSPLMEMRHSNLNPNCGSVQTEQHPSCDFTLSNQDLRRNVPYQNQPLSADSNLRPAQHLADTHVQSSHQNVDRLLFRHWPKLQPLTHVDEEMFDFLNQDDIPKFFILPTSSASLMIAVEGICLNDVNLSSQDVFVGILGNKTLLTIKNPSFESTELTLPLNLYTEQEEDPSFDINKIAPSLISYALHADKKFNPCGYNVKDNKLEVIFDKIDLSDVKEFPHTNVGRIRKFSSKDKLDNDILECLQGPLLSADSHFIPEALQQVTLPLSKDDRELDLLKRKEALKAVVAYASCMENYKASSHFYDSAKPETKKDGNFLMLTGLKGLNQITATFLGDICFKVLKDVKSFRLALRAKSTAQIK